MQIEVKPEDYEVLPPKKPNNLRDILKKIKKYSYYYGGWHSIIGLCLFFFVLINFLLSIIYSPNDTISFVIQGQRIVLPPNESGILTLFGTNFYPFITYLHEYHRWITSIFLHFGFLHLGFNVLGTYIFGSFLQKLWNTKITFIVFFLSGIVASIGSFLINKGNSAGASGGVFGLMGALIAFFWWEKGLDQAVRKYMLKQFGFILLINIFLGIIEPRIDLVGHITGFLAGLGFGRIFLFKRMRSKDNLLLFIWISSIGFIFYAFIHSMILYFRFVAS